MDNFIEMGKTSLTYITQENEELSAGIEKLKSGDLSASELDKLTDNARSLYEALVVLRYKAFEKQLGREVVEPVSEATVKEEEPVEETIKEETSFEGFDLTSEEEFEAESSETMFDFSGSAEPEKVEEVEEKEPEVEAEEFDINSFEEEEEVEETENEEEDDESLNAQFADNRDGSLRKQLGRSPISDLKSEIGIAKKFEYINSMFNGKTEVYDSAINELNSCGSDEAAKNLLNDYAKEYNWDLDNKSIIKFIELVERRYI